MGQPLKATAAAAQERFVKLVISPIVPIKWLLNPLTVLIQPLLVPIARDLTPSIPGGAATQVIVLTTADAANLTLVKPDVPTVLIHAPTAAAEHVPAVLHARRKLTKQVVNTEPIPARMAVAGPEPAAPPAVSRPVQIK